MTEQAQVPRPRDGVLDIAAYVPGKSGAKGNGKVHKLSSNESPLGPSAAAQQAYAACAGDLHLYPDGAATALREALAELHGINPANIVCGAGSDELLNLLASGYLQPGDEAIYTEHGFLVYPIVIKANGATPVVVPEKNLVADVDAILAAVTPRTRIVFLANPNNPTGTYVRFDEVKRLHAGLPKDCLLVLDAAYAEYVRRNDYEFGHRAGVAVAQRGDDPDFFEGLRAGGSAARLGLLSAQRGGRAQPHSRAVQRGAAFHRSRCGGGAGYGASDEGGGTQRCVAAEGGGCA